MEVTFSPLKGSLKTPKKVTGKNLEYGPGKKWWQKTQCKNATAKHLQDAAGKKALSLALCLLDTYKNMYIYYIYILQMPASEISYTSLMFESSFDSPGSLSRFSSKIPTQAIPRAARPAAMPFASPTSKQMPSLKDHRILHPPRLGCNFCVMMQFSVNRLGMILLFVSVNHQVVPPITLVEW